MLGSGFEHGPQRFPKNSTKKVKELVASLDSGLDRLVSLPRGPERDKLKCTNDAIAALIESSARPGTGGGLRADLQILGVIDGKAFEVITDITVVNATKKTARAVEMKHAMDSKKSDNSSPALLAKVKEKMEKYAPLIAFTKKIRADAAKPQPVFLVSAVSTHGEFSKSCIELQEILVRAYKSKIKSRGSRPDGHTPEFLASKFRVKLRCNLLVASMIGTVLMIKSAGLDRRSCRKFCRYGISN